MTKELDYAEKVRRSIAALERDRDMVAPPEHVNCYDLAIVALKRSGIDLALLKAADAYLVAVRRHPTVVDYEVAEALVRLNVAVRAADVEVTP